MPRNWRITREFEILYCLNRTVVGGERGNTEQVVNASHRVRVLVCGLVDGRVHDGQCAHRDQTVLEHEREQERRRRLNQFVELLAVSRQLVARCYDTIRDASLTCAQMPT